VIEAVVRGATFCAVNVRFCLLEQTALGSESVLFGKQCQSIENLYAPTELTYAKHRHPQKYLLPRRTRYTNMSGMNRYVPSEELIRYGPAQSRSTVDHPCMVDLIKLVMMYGPVPSNYKIIFFHTKRPKTRIGEWRLAYMEIPTNVRITHHPCSPSGVQAREPIGREFSDDREDDIAVFHPALPPYKAGRLLFTEHDDWYTAIAAGLASVGIKDNGEGITAEVVESIHNRLEEQATDDPNWTLQRKLYHRADRGTMVFKNEPEMARVAKFFGQDLVVLCPPIPDDGSCWDHFWNAVNRPPLRFRHGPGEQCRNQFIVVACFPKFSSNSQDVHWLTVAPNNDFKITWDSYLKRSVRIAHMFV
jgi:hypothetical protein